MLWFRQWGKGKSSSSGTVTVSFPIAFTISPIVAASHFNSVTSSASIQPGNETTTSFDVRISYTVGNTQGDLVSDIFTWVAIGT